MPAAFAVEVVDEGRLVVEFPDPDFPRRLLAFLEQDSRPGERVRRRDALIRELATRYGGSRKARAMALLADAIAYETTAWKVHKRLASPPKELEGTARWLLWHAFRAHPHFPTSWRQIWNIIR